MPNVSNPLLGHSLEDTLALIKRKACSVTELTEATLDAFDVIGTELNAVARTEREAALAQATQLDRLNAAEAQRRPLFGAVLAHKDLYSRKDWELRAGSNIVHGAAGVTAAPLKKLDRAGAVDCARLSTVEFALGVTGHNAITGDVKNPWNPMHLPGGSSSGSRQLRDRSLGGAFVGARHSGRGDRRCARQRPEHGQGSRRLSDGCTGLVGSRAVFLAATRRRVVAARLLDPFLPVRVNLSCGATAGKAVLPQPPRETLM